MNSIILDRVRRVVRHSEMTQTDIGKALGISPQRVNDLLVRPACTQLQRLESVLQLLDGHALTGYCGGKPETSLADKYHHAKNVIRDLNLFMEES